MSNLLTVIDALREQVVAYAPDPEPPTEIDTRAIVGMISKICVPVLFSILGVIFIGRGISGQVSKVATSSAIAIFGVVFILGGVSFLAWGDTLLDVLFT